MKNNKRNNKKQNIGCEFCSNCIPIGEGDHICDGYDVPKMVISDYMPTDEYLVCRGAYYQE